jgi:hypothetical protein
MDAAIVTTGTARRKGYHWPGIQFFAAAADNMQCVRTVSHLWPWTAFHRHGSAVRSRRKASTTIGHEVLREIRYYQRWQITPALCHRRAVTTHHVTASADGFGPPLHPQWIVVSLAWMEHAI